MSTVAQSPNPLDDPHVREHPGTLPFWQAAAQGRFVLPTCTGCGKAHWYPRSFCPFCFASPARLRPASGRGTVYSFSVSRLVSDTHVVAYVTLAEGPTMLTCIVDCAVQDLRIGQAVKLVFRPSSNGIPVPVFTPDSSGQAA